MTQEKISNLKISLLISLVEAQKHKEEDDGGTCNFDSPVLVLPSEWKESDVRKAFENTGLRYEKMSENSYEIFGATEGQALRRTIMAMAFRDSLTKQGYIARVHYVMD